MKFANDKIMVSIYSLLLTEILLHYQWKEHGHMER